MERKLHYTSENTLYLLLNIIAHDVIHDYGPSGCSKARWEKNQSLVKQFYSDYLTFSNPYKGGEGEPEKRAKTNSGFSTTTTTTTNEDSPSSLQVGQIDPIRPNIRGFVPIPGRRILKAKRPGTTGPIAAGPPIFPGIGRTIGTMDDKIVEDYVSYINALKNMKSMVSTTVIFTFFNHFLYTYLYTKVSTIDYKSSYFYIVPLESEINQELFEDLCNKFIGFCYLNQVAQIVDYKDYLQILCNYLSSYATEQTILENIVFNESGIGIKRRTAGGKKKQYGGKDQTLTVDEAKELIKEITDLYKKTETTDTLIELTGLLKTAVNLTEEQKKEYTSKRKDLLKGFKDIFLSKEQKKKAGSIEGDFSFIPPINVRRGRSSETTLDLSTSFIEKLKTLLLDIHQIINDDEKRQNDLEKKRLDNLNAAMSGKLTTEDKIIRNYFSSFIAKSGLFLTNICDSNGVINTQMSNLSLSNLSQDSALRKEINCLLYIADWTNNAGWQEIKSQDLDTILIDFFATNYNSYQITEQTQDRYVCSRSDNYVVNNAAKVETSLKNKSFCPYSSILDGMQQCSWNTSKNNREFGNMDFYITDENEQIFYNGKVEIHPNTIDLNLFFNVQVRPNIILTGSKQTKINSIDLEAHFVLKNTLVNVIEYVLSVDDATRTQIFTGGDIFGNLFKLFVINGRFNIVYSEILFKGTGDLFQEINCVTKYGGYTMDSTYTVDPGILSYKTSTGDQLRLFAANDRPSGTRFIFMLINGNPKEINMKAVGGYYSDDYIFLVKRAENTNICGAISGGKKKKSKLTKKLYKNKKHKMKTKRRR